MNPDVIAAWVTVLFGPAVFLATMVVCITIGAIVEYAVERDRFEIR